MLLLLCICIAAAAALFALHGPHRRFRASGVRHLPPLPLLGDMGRVVFRLTHWQENMVRIYKRFPGERFFGVSEFFQPVIVIRDPELAKTITCKDIHHFYDRGAVVDPNVDDIFGRGIFSLRGDEWKDMRSKLNPLFSSSKLRAMSSFMEVAGDNLVKKLKSSIQESEKDFIDLDVKDVCMRYATDVYAAGAFGLNINSHNAQDAKFYEICKSLVQLKFKEMIKFLGFYAVPKLMKILNIKWLSDEPADFFKKLFMETLRNREQNDIDRPDLIGWLLQVRKGNLVSEKDMDPMEPNAAYELANEAMVETKAGSIVWSDKDFLAQALGFMVAGVESVAAPMCFLVHMMALYPDVQDKLLAEINDVKRNGGKLDYDTVKDLTYLDMVVSELLRLWSSSFSERVCTKDYNLGKPNESATEDYIIRKGESIRIYNRAFHLDPAYFPNPHRFDPERFSADNRRAMRPGTYIPFGMGPRHCIAIRFAILELKIMICTLLQHIEASACAKTSSDIRLSTAYMVLSAKGGHWVRIQLRK